MVLNFYAGTTSPGRKFVLVGANSFLCNLADFSKEFDLDSTNDTVFAASPATFDPFYVDIFLALGGVSLPKFFFKCVHLPNAVMLFKFQIF